MSDEYHGGPDGPVADSDDGYTNNHEREMCGHCNGRGEGMHEGTTCLYCHGKGELPTEEEIEAEQYERDRADDMKEEAARERYDAERRSDRG